MVRQMERSFNHPQNLQLQEGLQLKAVHKDLTGSELGKMAEYKRDLYDLVLSDRWLCNRLGIQLPKENRHIRNSAQLLELMINSGYFIGDHRDRLRAVKDRVNKPIIQQATRDLFVLVRKNQSGQFVDYEVLYGWLHHRDKGIRMVARKYILQILNN